MRGPVSNSNSVIHLRHARPASVHPGRRVAGPLWVRQARLAADRLGGPILHPAARDGHNHEPRMSEFKFACPTCGQHIAGDERWAGRQIKCPACQADMMVPELEAPPTPAPAPAPAPPVRLSV